MSSLHAILVFLFDVFFAYCAISVIYLFLFSFAGSFLYRKKLKYASKGASSKRIAILVPVYKEDAIIKATADNLLGLDYPRELFDLYIIADSLQSNTVQDLKKLPLDVLEVSFLNSTKTKSLNEAFNRISKPYDIALICDGDNFLENDFLKKISQAFEQGVSAVQGKRVAKNLDSSFAYLDACSEAINNHIYRKGPNAIGLSSSVAGSGMAFEYNMVRGILADIDAVGGFDKILQLKLVQNKIHIYFLDDALIYDEKVGSAKDFKKQRKRWVSSQFINLKRFFLPAVKELFKGNISYFNLTAASNFILPKVFFIVLLPLLMFVTYFIRPGAEFWTALLMILYLISLALAIPPSLLTKELFYAILSLPKAILVMFQALFHMKKSNQKFIHTPHTKTEVSAGRGINRKSI